MTDAIFDWCVTSLHTAGNLIGLTYREINVLLFVFLHPMITVGLIIYALTLKRK